MLGPCSLLSDDIGGALQKELTECLPRFLIERGRLQSCPHMRQPGASLGGANPEARVRFAQAQPPPGLGLPFIAPKELNEESGELFGRAPEALAWKERAKDRVASDARVKCCREPLATGFTAQRAQQFRTHFHEQIVRFTLLSAARPWGLGTFQKTQCLFCH